MIDASAGKPSRIASSPGDMIVAASTGHVNVSGSNACSLSAIALTDEWDFIHIEPFVDDQGQDKKEIAHHVAQPG